MRFRHDGLAVDRATHNQGKEQNRHAHKFTGFSESPKKLEAFKSFAYMTVIDHYSAKDELTVSIKPNCSMIC